MKDARMTQCIGAAHSNAHIDNCGMCLGHSWGKYFSCPECPPWHKLKLAASGKSGQCPMCKKRFVTNLALLDEFLETGLTKAEAAANL